MACLKILLTLARWQIKKKFESIITLTGFSKENKVKKLGNINFWVESKVYNFIENIHQIIILSMVDCFNKTKIR